MTKTPIMRPVSLLNTAITLSILAVLTLSGWLIAGTFGGMCGALIYLGLSQLLRGTITWNHRKAIVHCKAKEYEKAIPEFKTSYDFFHANPWIDNYRALTLLSASGMCYREMALVSLGFCYGQIGDGQNSRVNYEKCLELFPNNEMAKSAIRLMDSAVNSANS
jgi:tetratricopeptide (TPR) repeat protein